MNFYDTIVEIVFFNFYKTLDLVPVCVLCFNAMLMNIVSLIVIISLSSSILTSISFDRRLLAVSIYGNLENKDFSIKKMIIMMISSFIFFSCKFLWFFFVDWYIDETLYNVQYLRIKVCNNCEGVNIMNNEKNSMLKVYFNYVLYPQH